MINYIYGAGGHGKVVHDAMLESKILCDGFIDDASIEFFLDLPVKRKSIISQQENIAVHLAIGSCKAREALAREFIDGTNFFSVIHPRASISRSSVIGIGTFLAANSVVAPSVKIGMHCIVNHGACIDHDSFIGNFSHVGPGALLNGGVRVGQGVFIGAGSIVLPGVVIGEYSVIGAGSVVLSDVDSNTVIVGNPARIIQSL